MTINSNTESDQYKTAEDDFRKKTFSLGFSPCPNDTFMFDALVNGRVLHNDISFDVQLEDVETLNKLALKEELDITKLSFSAFTQVADKYEMLTSGSALGTGVGPLFISKKIFDDPKNQIKSVAIPGKNTTAYFLFRIFYPGDYQVKEMIFSGIENAVLNNIVDAGIIIHENRFTYQQRGLNKISDLGDLWEKLTGGPIPLGGIAVRRSLDHKIKKRINALIRQSIEYAFANPADSYNYVRKHSQEMDEDVIKKHIELYVNKYSVDLGIEGKEAVKKLFELSKGHIENLPVGLFVEE